MRRRAHDGAGLSYRKIKVDQSWCPTTRYYGRITLARRGERARGFLAMLALVMPSREHRTTPGSVVHHEPLTADRRGAHRDALRAVFTHDVRRIW